MNRIARWGGLLTVVALVAVLLMGGGDEEAKAETPEPYDPATQICEGFGEDDFVFDTAVADERDRVKEEFEGDEEDNNLAAIDAFVENRETCSMDTSSTSTTVAECDTWPIARVGDHGNNRWFTDGLREIREADTDEEARDAAEVWVNQTKDFANLLSGAAAYFKVDEDVKLDTLIDGGCASDDAVQLVAELELALADARITPEDAPANGTNSGVNADGDVVAASHAGITGDRDAIKVVLKDGTVVWIMARCGNPVVVGAPPVPPGPTDNPPPTTTTTVVTTTTTVPSTTPTTAKPRTSDRCLRNPQSAGCPPFPRTDQEPQDNDTAEDNGVDTDEGDVPEPEPSRPGPSPRNGQPAPDPEEDKPSYDSGDDDGSDTPGGTREDPDGSVDGGGGTPATGDPVVVEDESEPTNDEEVDGFD